MNCPQCGKEMETGRLVGHWPLIWTPREKKRLLICRKDEVQLFNGAPTAYICKDCRKVVVDY